MQLVVTQSEPSMKALKDKNSALYLFQAVRYGQPTRDDLVLLVLPKVGFGGGYPLVWCRKSDYLPTTNIDWDDGVEAYITDQAIKEKTVVTMGSHIKTALGQTVEVNNGEMKTAVGSAGVIQINNKGQQKWFCGLARTVNKNLAPTCAFPLHGTNQIMITPTDKVLVMFAADVSKVGVAVTTAWNYGLLVTFDAQNGDHSRTVKYDIEKGWCADNAVWAEPVVPDQDLGKLLITPSDKT